MVITVTNVQQLYDAVNDVNNAGNTILLKQTTQPYVLTRTHAQTDRQNKGRLELQKNMSLIGEGDNCVIETSAQDPPLFLEGNDPRYGMIRAGRGEHRIHNLELKVPTAAGAGISTDLIGTLSTHIDIRNVKSGDPDPTGPSQDGSRGVDIRNTGAALIGRRVVVRMSNCEFYGGKQGIRIANFSGARECEISVQMSRIVSKQNLTGCLIVNQASHRSATSIETAKWTTQEWLHFLKFVQDQITKGIEGDRIVLSVPPGTAPPSARMEELDKAFRLTRSGNSEIAFQWLLMSIHNRYEPAYPRLEEFLLSVGRRKFIRPLYQELAKTPEGKARACEIYRRARPTYHPIAVASIDADLKCPV